MAGTASSDVLLDVLVFVLPVAVLLTLLLLLSRRRRRARSPAPVHAVATPTRVAVEPDRRPVIESVEVITGKIERAIANGEKASLAGLYLDLAHANERLSNGDARMSALRSAAGYGALHGPPSAHASARLALGEAAHQAGDLTSACEQWQMARAAFLESGDTEQHDRVETRMRENGCPTDWVLTDF
ncbi:MAG: hypothetical protein JSR99_09830 [Proteobacteria bacterium]|nr:hypothetical protein [Pseudomonadota bacterium]